MVCFFGTNGVEQENTLGFKIAIGNRKIGIVVFRPNMLKHPD